MDLQTKCPHCGCWCDASTLPYENCRSCGLEREVRRKKDAESMSQSIRNQIETGYSQGPPDAPRDRQRLMGCVGSNIPLGGDGVMDDFAAILIEAVMAQDALDSHECKENPRWCPGHDIGCDEASQLSNAAGYWQELAVEAIVKRGYDVLFCAQRRL